MDNASEADLMQANNIKAALAQASLSTISGNGQRDSLNSEPLADQKFGNKAQASENFEDVLSEI